MDMNKKQLEKLLDDSGVSGRAKAKVLRGFDERSSSATPPASRGHGAPAPDSTQVNVL